ncbi:MAG: hypothetical protein AAFV25_23735, partial [Bacteroidota bacterium]
MFQYKVYILLICLWMSSQIAYAQIAINEDGGTADSSAILDISSSDKGLLIPRMDSISRQAIANPAQGLLVYDFTTQSFWYHADGWTEIDRKSLDFPLSNGDSLEVLATDGRGNLFWAENEDAQRLILADDSLRITNGNAIDLGYLRDIDLGQLSMQGYAQSLVRDAFQTGQSWFWTGSSREWQSFTPNYNGYIARIDFKIQDDFDNIGYFALYEGQGLDGEELLFIDSINIINNWNSIRLDTFEVALEKGSHYTFLMGEYGTRGYEIGFLSGDPYRGGISSRSPFFDYIFRSFMLPDTTVNDIFQVNANLEGYGINLTQLDTLHFADGTHQITALPDPAGASNQFLVVDQSGTIRWDAQISDADNLGDHTATQNIRLSGQWISNDGQNEGVHIDNGGNVGIGTDAPKAKLDVNGEILLSHGATQMGLMTELENSTPILNLSVNARTPVINTPQLGGMFRIDSRTTAGDPLFQWIQKPAGSATMGRSDLLMSLDQATGLEVNGAVGATSFSAASFNGATGNGGITIDNNGVVTTSNLLQVGGYVAANNYLSISNNGQALTLATDEANNRIILDVGGSGHSSDAIVLGEVGTGSQNPVLMQGNLVVGGLSSPSSNYKLTVNGEPAANGYRQFTNYSDRRLK